MTDLKMESYFFNYKHEQIVIIGLFLLLHSLPLFALDVNVKDPLYGASGNGVTDDTASIQAAIDAVHASGGGEVYIPDGVYSLSIQPAASTGIDWPKALKVYENITIRGESRDGAILHLEDNAGQYGAIIAGSKIGDDLSNFKLTTLSIDANSTGNLISSVNDLNMNASSFSDARPRTAFSAFDGASITLENIKIDNHEGVWSVYFSGSGQYITDAKITGCVLTNIGGGTVDFDSSTIYTSGNGVLVANNALYTKGAGTLGQRSGIEVHNLNTLVTNNNINGFINGINIGGSSAIGHTNIVVSENVINDAFHGVVLFPDMPKNSNPISMDSVIIDGNHINLTFTGSLDYPAGSRGTDATGIGVLKQGTQADIHNLAISDNLINYTDSTSSQPLRTPTGDIKSHGISLKFAPSSSNAGEPIEGLIISGNQIINAPANGIHFEGESLATSINYNTVTNAGSSPYVGFFLPSERGMIFLSGTNQTFSLLANTGIDTRGTPKMILGLADESSSLVLGKAIDTFMINASGNPLSGSDTLVSPNAWQETSRDASVVNSIRGSAFSSQKTLGTWIHDQDFLVSTTYSSPDGAILIGNGATAASLKLNGCLVNSPDGLIVLADSSLEGSGSINGYTVGNNGSLISGDLTFNDGLDIFGTLTPGNGIGSLSAKDMILNGSALWRFDIQDLSMGAGTGWDFINIQDSTHFLASPSSKIKLIISSFALDSNPGFLNGFDSSNSYQWTILQSGSLTGFSAGLFDLDTSGFQNSYSGTFSLSQNGNSLQLSFNPLPVPEPSSMAQIMLGLSLIVILLMSHGILRFKK